MILRHILGSLGNSWSGLATSTTGQVSKWTRRRKTEKTRYRLQRRERRQQLQMCLDNPQTTCPHPFMNGERRLSRCCAMCFWAFWKRSRSSVCRVCRLVQSEPKTSDGTSPLPRSGACGRFGGGTHTIPFVAVAHNCQDGRTGTWRRVVHPDLPDPLRACMRRTS